MRHSETCSPLAWIAACRAAYIKAPTVKVEDPITRDHCEDTHPEHVESDAETHGQPTDVASEERERSAPDSGRRAHTPCQAVKRPSQHDRQNRVRAHDARDNHEREGCASYPKKRGLDRDHRVGAEVGIRHRTGPMSPRKETKATLEEHVLVIESPPRARERREQEQRCTDDQ